MASINGIQLKNIKRNKNIYKGRIDMDGKHIGNFSLFYMNGICSGLKYDINTNSKKYLSGDVSLEDYEEKRIIFALNTDSKNKDEFLKRVSLYYRDKNLDDIFGLNNSDFLIELFRLYLTEKQYYFEKSKGKRKKKPKFNIVVNMEE